jgi:ubiquinone/menaquinone biosynthesis C-methylase UbiE
VPAGKALDVCCGLGTNTVYLARAGFETTAIDISQTAVSQARRKAREAGVDIRFWVGSTLELPFERDEFDFIFDMGCFHHIRPPDRDRFVQCILRVLKKGGYYFMVCFSDKNGPAWNHFSDVEILDIFSPHFEAIEMQHFSSLEGDGHTRFFYATLFGPR